MSVPADAAERPHAVEPVAELTAGALGLFVVWPGGSVEEDQALRALGDRLIVRSVTHLEWTLSRRRENYLRFCGGRTRPARGVLASRAMGTPILVITATDPDPRPENRGADAATDPGSVHLAEGGARLRALAGGEPWVHCAESPGQATRDLMMLFGIDATTHLREYASPWDGVVQRVRRDVVGAGEWDSLTQLLHTLNHTVRYLVLRNFEHLPEQGAFGAHDDIDLLTDRYRDLVAILNARPLLKRVPRWGGRFFVRVAGETVIVDLRFPGDRYYDPRWARAVLDRRVWCERGFYTPNAEDYFETLAYHAILQKRRLTEEYQQRLAAMARTLGRPEWDEDHLREPARAHALIQDLVRARGYRIAKPRDVTVFYNFAAAGARWPEVRRRLARARRAVVRYGVPWLVHPLHRVYRATFGRLNRSAL